MGTSGTALTTRASAVRDREEHVGSGRAEAPEEVPDRRWVRIQQTKCLEIADSELPLMVASSSLPMDSATRRPQQVACSVSVVVPLLVWCFHGTPEHRAY